MVFLSSFAVEGIAAKAARTMSNLTNFVRSALAEIIIFHRLQASLRAVSARFFGSPL